MSKILILGGYGYTGRLLARHLLEQTGAEIVLAGRNLDKAQAYSAALNSEFQGQRTSAVRADAASRQELREALRGIDLLLVAAPTTRHADTVIRAALEAGVDYLDVQLGAEKLALLRALAPQIEQAGRCFITEAGFHPGLPSAMVRFAAAQLERLDSAVVACYLNMGQALPYSEAVDELMEIFVNYNGQVFKDGQWTKPGSFHMRKIDFGDRTSDRTGDRIGIRNSYSMYFEELGDLPEMIPSLRELGFYMSETHWLVDWVITSVVFLGLKIAPRRGIRPLGRLMWWGMQTFARAPYLVLLKIEAQGERNGAAVRLDSELSHPDGYELTAIPVVACLMQYLDGTARRPGLWMMGHLVDPVRLFKEMEGMGVSVSSIIR